VTFEREVNPSSTRGKSSTSRAGVLLHGDEAARADLTDDCMIRARHAPLPPSKRASQTATG
jgi:hypothetical protein